jgi:Na+/H+ antiporter NhaC
MQQSWIVLLPPCIVLISSLISRKLFPSLLLGLFSGVYIAQDYRLMPTIKLLICRIYEQIVSIEAISVYTFMFGVGILISIINYTGAATAFAQRLKQRITTKKSAELSAVYFLALLSLDDYLNCLTTGYIMRPIADSLKIARAKLAYILHSFAGPLVVIIPISTWATFITSQLDLSGISAEHTACTKILSDPFLLYIQSIPYTFYAFFSMIAATIVIIRSLSFGPMFTEEQQSTAAIATEDDIPTQVIRTTPLDLFLPLITLVSSILFGLLFTGGFWLFGGTNSMLEAFKSTDKAFQVLGIASILTIITSFTLSLVRKQIQPQTIAPLVGEGVKLMFPVIVLILIASTLGIVLRIDLHTGEYLASLLLSTIQPAYLPLLFFLVSALIATMIGTSWGTMTLLLPIGIPMLHTLVNAPTPALPGDITLLIPMIGAILAGSTFGDHTSPIAAASIMAATSARCDTLKHVITQYPYALAPFIGSCIGYTAMGYSMSSNATCNNAYLLACITGLTATIAVLYLQNYLAHRVKPSF